MYVYPMHCCAFWCPKDPRGQLSLTLRTERPQHNPPFIPITVLQSTACKWQAKGIALRLCSCQTERCLQSRQWWACHQMLQALILLDLSRVSSLVGDWDMSISCNARYGFSASTDLSSLHSLSLSPRIILLSFSIVSLSLCSLPLCLVFPVDALQLSHFSHLYASCSLSGLSISCVSQRILSLVWPCSCRQFQQTWSPKILMFSLVFSPPSPQAGAGYATGFHQTGQVTELQTFIKNR